MKFSILIPAFKDTFIKECIDSCLAQTYNNFEIIIANDHSPYDLDSIILEYSNNKHLKYYKNEIGYGAEHLVDNWNHCLEYATGDYVICIGDDDKLKPKCLEYYNTLITLHPDLDVYHMRMEIINEYSEVIAIQEERPDTETVYSMIWNFWKGRRQVIGDWCFNRKTLNENGGFINLPYGWSSDNITAFRLAMDKGVANFGIQGFQYIESSLSISSKQTPHVTIGKIKAWMIVDTWYQSFLNNTEPIEENDKKFKLNISNTLEKYINRKIEGELENGIHDFPYSPFEWLKVGKETNISISLIIRLYLRALKKKALKKPQQ